MGACGSSGKGVNPEVLASITVMMGEASRNPEKSFTNSLIKVKQLVSQDQSSGTAKAVAQATLDGINDPKVQAKGKFFYLLVG